MSIGGIVRFGLAPQEIGHGVEIGKGGFGEGGIAAVEDEAAGLEQAAAQGLLEQPQAEGDGCQRGVAPARAFARPRVFDHADALDHHLVVEPVRATMERQAEDPGGLFARGQEQAVAAEILEADRLAPEPVKQAGQGSDADELAGEEVMALEAGIVPGGAGPVDGAERQGCARPRAARGYP